MFLALDDCISAVVVPVKLGDARSNPVRELPRRRRRRWKNRRIGRARRSRYVSDDRAQLARLEHEGAMVEVEYDDAPDLIMHTAHRLWRDSHGSRH